MHLFPVFAEYFWEDQDVVTFTSVPGLSHPQRLASEFCWITMLSPRMCGNF